MNDHAKRIADKYIGRNGGAPEPTARIKSPTRVGGEFLGPEKMDDVATLFAFLEIVRKDGQKALLQTDGLKSNARVAQHALARLLGVPESDLCNAVTLYLKQCRP